MEIYNSLTSRKESFVPLEGKKVQMYVCGITPYDKSHLGHARTLVSFDIIRRHLLFRGYQVKYAQNVTDIDDKIIRRAKERKMLPLELSEKYGNESALEFETLGIMKPDFSPKVSEYVPQIVALIGRIETRGFAYRTESGVYFDVLKFEHYGKLSHQSPDTIKSGARIEVDEKKKNPQDFALWKLGQEKGATFGSPWGEGRPGWHIECSAMAGALLGDTIDIHGGARDLIFPHHENEIAQSEAATGKPFARFFMHTGFLTVSGEKMAKSLGNFITIEDGLRKFPPQDLRMLFALTHYQSPIDFTEEAVNSAGNSLRTLHSAIMAARTYSSAEKENGSLGKESDDAERKFIEAMDDNFDTPAALTCLFALAKRINGACSLGEVPENEAREAGKKLESLLAVLGLAPSAENGSKGIEEDVAAICRKFAIGAHGGLEGKVNGLLTERNEARKRKDFTRSDAIRKALLDAGVILEDRKDGSASWRLAK
jgi:cysteinyl-tRNA synthetase